MKTWIYQSSRSLLDLCPRSIRYTVSNVSSEAAGQIKANFHVELPWIGERKFIWMVAFTWPRVDPIPMYGTIRGGGIIPLNSSSLALRIQEQRENIGNQAPWLNFQGCPFLRHGQICPCILLYGKTHFQFFIGYICNFLIQNRINVSG